MISLRTHNVLDYVLAAVLVACPYLFAFNDIPAARNIFLVLGFGLAAYSLCTDYYYSFFKFIPIGFHMTLDVSAGLITLLAPWLFGYSILLTGTQLAVHFVMGLGAIGLVAMTNRISQTPITVSEDEVTEIRRAA